MAYDIDYRTGKRRNRYDRGRILKLLILFGCFAARFMLSQTLQNLRRILFPAQAVAAFAQSLLPM